MSLTTLLNRPCTITSRAAGSSIDDYGNLIPEETEVETVCELQQKTRNEPAGEGELSVTQWLVILPAGTVVDTAATLQVDGQVYEFVGDPWTARNPRTQLVSHVEGTVIKAGS